MWGLPDDVFEVPLRREVGDSLAIGTQAAENEPQLILALEYLDGHLWRIYLQRHLQQPDSL